MMNIAKQYEMFSWLNQHNKSEKPITDNEAVKLLLDFFGFDKQIVFDAILEADTKFSFKSNRNPAIGISRWGDINEYIAQQLEHLKGYEYRKNDGQPTLINKERNIQIIIMSGNKALGNIDLPISANCVKGKATQDKISLNSMKDEVKTWILYYPSKGHEIYENDNPNLVFELARPISFQKIGSKKIFPTDHDCRLMFVLKGETQSYISEFADEALNEDSFDIEYKLIGNDE